MVKYRLIIEESLEGKYPWSWYIEIFDEKFYNKEVWYEISDGWDAWSGKSKTEYDAELAGRKALAVKQAGLSRDLREKEHRELTRRIIE